MWKLAISEEQQWDYSTKIATPQIGDRLLQFLQVEEFIHPQFPGSSNRFIPSTEHPQ